MSLIRVESLAWHYEGAAEPALRGVSFEVERGEFVAVMGRTGAGKSTLCRCLNALIPRHSRGTMEGRVLVAGLDTARSDFYEIAGRVGIVFQDPETQFIMMTVEDEIALGLENRGVEPQAIRAAVERALAAVGLPQSYLGKPPTELSGGQKQRVAIAAMLALEPEILVLDEPTSDLDPAGKAEVFAILERLKAERAATVILVSHDSEQVARYADRVLVLDQGRVALAGPTAEVLGRVRELAALGIAAPQVAQLGFLLGWPRPAGDPRAALQRLHGARLAPPAAPLARPESEPAVKVQGLEHAYPDGTLALRGVDLELRRGEYVAIVGSNGSGKTTLAKHLNGLLRPTRGSVWVAGVEAARVRPSELARRVGYCFQNPDHQLFCQTVEEELAFGPRHLGLSEAEVRARVERVLETVGLAPWRNEHPFFLGKGQRQRLAVGAALTIEPEIIIVDEPTTGQDHAMCEEIMALLDRLNQAGHTVVIITHDMELVAEHCRRVLVMADGRIIADGSPAQVFADAEVTARARIEPPQVARLSLALDPAQPPALSVPELARRLGAPIDEAALQGIRLHTAGA
jgi:energy-coupling factor transport system ATP-binding protein